MWYEVTTRYKFSVSFHNDLVSCFVEFAGSARMCILTVFWQQVGLRGGMKNIIVWFRMR